MCECRLSWIASGQVHWWVFVTVVTKFEAHESRKYVNSYVATYQLCKKNSAPWSCVGLHACSNKICHFPKYQTLCVGDTQRSFHTFWTTPLDGCKWPLPHSWLALWYKVKHAKENRIHLFFTELLCLQYVRNHSWKMSGTCTQMFNTIFLNMLFLITHHYTQQSFYYR